MTTPKTTPFERRETVDKPGIVGARWWNEALADPVPRRQALTALLALGGVLTAAAAVGGIVYAASRGTDEVSFAPKVAVDMQRAYGWDFGARGEPLVFDGTSTQPFERTSLASLESAMRPSSRWLRFWVPTLFESVLAQPRTTPAEAESAPFTPLRDVLVPLSTPAMDEAYRQGEVLATVALTDRDTAFIVDLDGPEAVAFAAGAAAGLEPIALIDNWPHPRGVVAAHRTLGAAAYYQPRFTATRDTRNPSAPPLFVLDRNRLAPYADDATQFDNRHVARLPSASALKGLGIKQLVYIGSPAIELDDLNDDFVAAAGAGIRVHAVGPTRDAEAYRAPPAVTPVPRKTLFSSGTSASASTGGQDASGAHPRPSNFGLVPVAIAVGTGAVLGARYARSGSWNRTSSGSSGS